MELLVLVEQLEQIMLVLILTVVLVVEVVVAGMEEAQIHVLEGVEAAATLTLELLKM
jgi:hypothetical protein